MAQAKADRPLRSRTVRAKRRAEKKVYSAEELYRAGAFTTDKGSLISSFYDAKGTLVIERVASGLGMSKSQLAETVGVRREAFYKLPRATAPKTQARVREMVEIVERVREWAGGKDQAVAWYRAQPISAFGGRTAESLVKDGRAGELRDYLDHLAMGGFA